MALGACPPTTIITWRGKTRARKPQTPARAAALCKETITNLVKSSCQKHAAGSLEASAATLLSVNSIPRGKKVISNLMHANYGSPINPSSLFLRWATCPFSPENTKPLGTTAHARLTAEEFLSEEDPSVISTASPLFSHYLHGGAKNNRCHLANKT